MSNTNTRISKDTTVVDLPSSKRLRYKRLPTNREVMNNKAFDLAKESIELIVHDLHNLLDDAGCDGIVDYAVLETSLKEVLSETINNIISNR